MRKQQLQTEKARLRDIDQPENRIQKHRRAMCAFVFVFMVFINCCGFPLYNLSRKWPLTIIAVNLYAVLVSAVITGQMLRRLFGKAGVWFVVLVTVVCSCMRLACRFLLEYGEVSNTYNFTVPNAGLHVVVFSAAVLSSWFVRKKRE